MGDEILLSIGGVGLFLLGMVVLTEGLRRLAGDALRRVLARSTRTPVRGVMAGALVTAIVQSSSATTVTAVGFVGAGLLTFPQGLGIILGANVGTTVTGWIVAILGFKLDLGLVVLPLVLVGVLLRMFSNTRLRHLGWALAGFGLLFIGIDAMQQGMAQLEGVITPDMFPGDTLSGRLQMLLLGVLITVITQSSSAGVAAALVALGAGTISLPQGAAMVIGMNVGTTFSAVLATLGGSTATRRTGFAHVIYNLLIGIMAFLLLGPFTQIVGPWVANGGTGNEQISLVAFHTAFNALGVLLVLPFTQPFARLIVRLVPEHGPPLLRRLDDSLQRDPAAAVDAVAATVRDITMLLTRVLAALLSGRKQSARNASQLTAINEALEATGAFVEKVNTEPAHEGIFRRHLATVHALDHLRRLAHRCGQAERLQVLHTEPRLSRLTRLLRLGTIATLREDQPGNAVHRYNRLRTLFRRERHQFREKTVVAAAQGAVGAQTTLLRLDGVRWLHRVAYHLWRISYHLRRAQAQAPTPPEARTVVVALEED